MTSEDAGTERRGPATGVGSPKRWYALAALWWTLAVLTGARWALADGAEARWLAGVPAVLAVGLGIACLVQARARGRETR